LLAKTGAAVPGGVSAAEWMRDMKAFNCHDDTITRAMSILSQHKNLRRFFRAQCGNQFKSARSFIVWMREGEAKAMDDALGQLAQRQGHSPE
jgi:Domain of unknown function (DUF6434)